MENETNQNQQYMHYRIVEFGKLQSLKGNHQEALRHYKEGLRMCAEQQAPEIFFRHYSQCVMESLELSGAYDDVIKYCDKTLNLLDGNINKADFLMKSYAETMERKAIQYLLKGEKETALEFFGEIHAKVGRGVQRLSDELLGWIQRGYMITEDQIRGAQKKYKYFSVRKENVDEKIAMELPKSVMPI